MTDRNWRDAKPKWVVEAAEAEMASMKRILALRWPTESRPTPMPFWWGDYGRKEGDPVAGTYWAHSHDGRMVYPVEIKPEGDGEINLITRWMFNVNRRGDHCTTDRGKSRVGSKYGWPHRPARCRVSQMRKAWNEYLLRILGFHMRGRNCQRWREPYPVH